MNNLNQLRHHIMNYLGFLDREANFADDLGIESAIKPMYVILANKVKECLNEDECELFDKCIGMVEASIGRMVPIPNRDYAIVQYSVYDADTLQVGFSVFDKEYAKEYIALLKEYFPIVEFEDGESYKAMSADGKRVSFSLEHSALLLEII